MWASRDLGATWTHSSRGLAYAEGETPIKTGWSLAVAHGRVYAGVEPAGLFVSDDAGASWTHLDGLQKHPSRPNWTPGGGGLNLHSIVTHPDDPKQLWIGISSVGVFHTADGGDDLDDPKFRRSRRFLARGHALSRIRPVRARTSSRAGHAEPALSAEPLRHVSQRRRRTDSGQSIEEGLPSSFGFPVAAHPRDPDRLYFLPLNGAEQGPLSPRRPAPPCGAATTAARAGPPSANGLPQSGAYFGVMRQAMATDRLDPAGVYFGSSNGSVYASRDEGETWTIAWRATCRRSRRSRRWLSTHERGPAPVVVRLPALLVALFPDAERVVKLEVDSVEELMDALEARWPGMRDRLCDSSPAIRRHINVFVDGKRSKLTTPLRAGADVFILTAVSGG